MPSTSIPPIHDELCALRQRVVDLEQALLTQTQVCDDLRALETAHRHAERRFHQLVDMAPDAMILTNTAGIIVLVNRQVEALFGYARSELIGQPIECLMPDSFRSHHGALRSRYAEAPYARPMGAGKDLTAQHKDGHELAVEISLSPLETDDETLIISTIRDISARKAAEAERAHLQSDLIRAQDALLQELSTPLIPISDRVVIMPLIGTVDTRRAQQLFDALLQGVERYRAADVLIDITGVAVIDTQVAGTLIRAAQAVRLLGAQVTLTGVRPEIAQTLVSLGVDLRGISTHATLQQSIARVLLATPRDRAPATLR